MRSDSVPFLEITFINMLRIPAANVDEFRTIIGQKAMIFHYYFWRTIFFNARNYIQAFKKLIFLWTITIILRFTKRIWTKKYFDTLLNCNWRTSTARWLFVHISVHVCQMEGHTFFDLQLFRTEDHSLRMIFNSFQGFFSSRHRLHHLSFFGFLLSFVVWIIIFKYNDPDGQQHHIKVFGTSSWSILIGF